MSPSFLLLFLLVSLPVVFPRVLNFDENTTDFKQTLPKPWMSLDQHRLAQTLADTNTTGFKLASAILQQQHPLSSILSVDLIYKQSNGTKLFIPNCDAISIYIPRLENETEILQNDPEILDRIRSGERRVYKKLEKRILRFDGGGNVSVSHQFIYTDDDEESVSKVVVHGISEGFENLNSYVNNQLYPYGRKIVADDGTEGMRIYGSCGFSAFVFPPTEDEQEFFSKAKMRIEMVIVANIVPTTPNIVYDPDKAPWMEMTFMYGSADKAIAHYKERFLPRRVTMMYALYF